MKARTFEYENRMAKALGCDSGLTLDQAVSAADSCTAELRQRCLAEVEASIHEIDVQSRQVTHPDDLQVTAIYSAANRIIGIAGIFERREVADAAYSLCDLIGRFRTRQQWSLAMVAVHVATMRRIRLPGQTAEQCRALKKGCERSLRRWTDG